MYVAALFLPLHFRGLGVFEDAFPAGVGTRLTIGFLIRGFTVPVVIGVGLALIGRRRVPLAAGVFVGAGVFSILEGLAQPFYALFRTRPLILMGIQILVGVLLILAASSAVSRRPALPPPP
jgi:hypothetical protein